MLSLLSAGTAARTDVALGTEVAFDEATIASGRAKKRAAQARIRGTMWEAVTPHGLRAGFVTTVYKNGVSDEEIMGHTRHRSLATMRSYVRRAKLGTSSPAGKLGL